MSVAQALARRAKQNRMAEIRSEHPYDRIAPMYDGLHRSEEALAEDRRVMKALDYRGGSVLDIGCGTGLLLDWLGVTGHAYVGIDPSREMLARMRRKHPMAYTVATDFERFNTTQKFDLIVGLYGSPSYVRPRALWSATEMLKPGGRFFLMFYAPGYKPVTHTRTGVDAPFYSDIPYDALPGEVSRLGNYVVVRGDAHEILPEAERVRGCA